MDLVTMPEDYHRLLMEDCRRYIDEHLSKGITPQSLAKHYNYEYASFRKTFKDVTEFSPHQYIRLRRLHQAAKLLRAGGTVKQAVKESGFKTLSGFSKAFVTVYGVNPTVYSKTRGSVRMSEPKYVSIDDAYIVGYKFQETRKLKDFDRGAFWLSCIFPETDAEEYARIGGDPSMVGIWAKETGKNVYLIGPHVPVIKHVPEGFGTTKIQGGLFACFKVPAYQNNVQLSEDVRTTLEYARELISKDPEYYEDKEKTAFEYYGTDGNYVCLPVRRR